MENMEEQVILQLAGRLGTELQEIRREERQFIFVLEDEPRRLVFDVDLGLLWYNAEGTEE